MIFDGMRSDEVMSEIAEQQGWTDLTQLMLVLEYVENQKDNDCFADFLRRKADEENDEESAV